MGAKRGTEVRTIYYPAKNVNGMTSERRNEIAVGLAEVMDFRRREFGLTRLCRKCVQRKCNGVIGAPGLKFACFRFRGKHG